MSLEIPILQVLGLSSSLILSGINFGASHLTIPLLYNLPVPTSTRLFSSLYHRGAITLVPLTLFSGLNFGTLAYLIPSQRLTYAIAGASTLSALAWTQIVIAPTNKRLCEVSEMGDVETEKVKGEEVDELLRRWKWMNFVRSGLALAGGLVGFSALLR
jgi:hypothetical protein